MDIPQSGYETTLAKTKAGNIIWLVRVLIYTHVLAVGICGLFSYLDRHGGFECDMPMQIIVVPIFSWATYSLFIYPVIIIGILISGKLKEIDIVITFILEAIITFAHIIAFLPLIQ